VLTELPATISAYALKEGLKKSVSVNYQYTQAHVAAVTAAPNGGAVFANQKISLKCKTEDAIIFYRFMTKEEIEKADAASESQSQEEEAATDEESTETEETDDHQMSIDLQMTNHNDEHDLFNQM
jgi:hypothetical protein